MSGNNDGKNSGSESQRAPSVNRRNVLKSIGVSGTALMGFSGGVTSKSNPEPADVTQLTGSKREEAIQSALSDDGIQKIKSEITKEDWEIDIGKAKTVRSDPSEMDSYRVVTIPCRQSGSDNSNTGSNNKQAGIRWIDNPPAEVNIEQVVGYEVIKEENPEVAEIETASPERDITSFRVESGKVVTQKEDMPEVNPSGVGTDAVTPPPNPGGGCPDGKCSHITEYCEGYNWDCVVTIAGTYAGMYVACANCGTANVVACGLCLYSVRQANNISCDTGANCETIYACSQCYCSDPAWYCT